MRRWTLSTLRYRIELAPGVREQLALLAEDRRAKVEARIAEMAELAALVPIPSAGGLAEERWAPPLHMDAGEVEITYRLRRLSSTLEVIGLTAL